MIKWFMGLKLWLKILLCVGTASFVTIATFGTIHVVRYVNGYYYVEENNNTDNDVEEGDDNDGDSNENDDGIEDGEDLNNPEDDNTNDNPSNNNPTIDPDDSTQPNNPTPSDPIEPSNPDNSNTPSDPIEPSNPDNSNTPSDPIEPSDPIIPNEPNEPEDIPSTETPEEPIPLTDREKAFKLIANSDKEIFRGFDGLVLGDGTIIEAVVDLSNIEAELDELCTILVGLVSSRYGDVNKITNEMLLPPNDEIKNTLASIENLLKYNLK